MTIIIAALLGVVVGALVATAIILHLFQKRGDRDWIEREIRACAEYRECLGDIQAAFDQGQGDARVIEQAWTNIRGFCREFRLTGWLFPAELRARLETLVAGLEGEEQIYRANGAGANGRTAQALCEQYHELDRVLRREMEGRARDLRKSRFLPQAIAPGRPGEDGPG
jgi:hypothetical protein